MFTLDELVRGRQQDLLREADRRRLIAQARRARGGPVGRMLLQRKARRGLAAMKDPSPRGARRRREAVLEDAAIFRGLPRRDLALLARHADPIDLPAGSILADEHNPLPQFIVLTAGVAERRLGGRRIGIVSQGDHFGELTLLDGERHTPTVTALSDVEGFVLGRREFWGLLAQSPALSMRLTTSVAHHLRRAEQQLADAPRRRVAIDPRSATVGARNTG